MGRKIPYVDVPIYLGYVAVVLFGVHYDSFGSPIININLTAVFEPDQLMQ